MGELGSEARSYHQEVGEFAKSLQLNTLLSLGVLSQSASDAFIKDNNINESSEHFNLRIDLVNHVYGVVTEHIAEKKQDLALLVKGSRSAHMEHVVTDIIEMLEQMDIKQDAAQQNSAINKKNIEGRA
jgi:UDP-N-acetylmuramoyl-tripeptide--D-alanyl-D-alanine ligase